MKKAIGCIILVILIGCIMYFISEYISRVYSKFDGSDVYIKYALNDNNSNEIEKEAEEFFEELEIEIKNITGNTTIIEKDIISNFYEIKKMYLAMYNSKYEANDNINFTLTMEQKKYEYVKLVFIIELLLSFIISLSLLIFSPFRGFSRPILVILPILFIAFNTAYYEHIFSLSNIGLDVWLFNTVNVTLITLFIHYNIVYCKNTLKMGLMLSLLNCLTYFTQVINYDIFNIVLILNSSLCFGVLSMNEFINIKDIKNDIVKPIWMKINDILEESS